MTMKRTGSRSRRPLTLASAALLAGSALLVVPDASADRPNRGSVKHSGARDPRDPRGITDPRGARDPRGVADPRGARDPRGPADPRGGSASGRYDARWNAWEDARRDYYRWRTINSLIRLGASYAMRPKTSTTVVVTGTTYYYSGGVYYVQSGGGYVVVPAPPGAVVLAVPTATTVVYAGSAPYYYYNGTYYIATSQPAPKPAAADTTVNVNVKVDSSGSSGGQAEPPEPPPMTEGDDHNFEAVAPPVGATVPYLPEEATEKVVGGKKYFVYDGTYYRPFASEGETIYVVVADPR